MNSELRAHSRVFGWRRLALAVSAALLLSSLGCDDLLEVKPEDQRIAVGALALNVCPDGQTGVGEVAVIATVFGTDGTRVKGVEVSFSSDRGDLDSSAADTDERGEARVTLSGERTADVAPIVVTAVHPEGETDDVTISWPANPPLCVEAADHVPPDVGLPAGCFAPNNVFTTELGRKVDLVISSLNPCNLSALQLTIDYDPAFVAFEEARKGGAFEDSGDPGMEQPTTLVVNDDPVGGVLDISYSQDPPDPPGTNTFAGPYLVLTFNTVALSPEVGGGLEETRFEIANYSFRDNSGLGYPPTDPLPAGPALFILEPAQAP